MPITQLWEKKDALALERRSKNKSRRKEPTDGGVEMERLVQAGSWAGRLGWLGAGALAVGLGNHSPP